MTLEVKHAHVSTIPDEANEDLVRPSDWNASHVQTMATDRILGRKTAAAGAVEELDAASVRSVIKAAYAVSVEHFGTGIDTAAFQAAIDALPADGGTIFVPAGNYTATVAPGSLAPGTKLITWLADKGVLLPALMPGLVQSRGVYSINNWSGNANRDGEVFYHLELGDHDTEANHRDRAIHVAGHLPDSGEAFERVLAAYSFTLTTNAVDDSAGDIRGLYGLCAANGGGANVRCVRVLAEGLNGHTGNLTGILATVTHTDSIDGSVGTVGDAVAVRGTVGAGCKGVFGAGAFAAAQRPTFAYFVDTGAAAPLLPEGACYFAHGGGNGAFLKLRRDYDGQPNATDVVYSVDRRGRTQGRSFYSGRATIADNAAIAIDDPNFSGNTGFIRFWERDNATHFGEAFYRANATPICTQVFSGAATVAFTTGALTGTTGVDGRLTVSAHTDGNLYIENRRGLSITVCWAFIATAEEVGTLS